MSETIKCPECFRVGNNLNDQTQVSYRCVGCGFTWPRNNEDHWRKLAEAQARIKVLESLLKCVEWDHFEYERDGDGMTYCPFCNGQQVESNYGHAGHKEHCELNRALSTTSNTEAIDRVVREAVEKATNLKGITPFNELNAASNIRKG